jgi:tetratricopeptide (TPR) repeat protein
MGLFSARKAKKKTEEGFTFHQMGDAPRAEATYREAINIHPPYADAHFRLAELLMEQNRIPEAEKEYDRAIRCAPEIGEYHCAIAELYHRIGQKEKAEKEYLKSIQLKPNYVIAYINLGTMYRDSARFGEATRIWQQGLQHCLDPAMKQEIVRKLRGEG